MPYTKKDFTLIANKNAIYAYKRLAEIILYHKDYDKDKMNDILDELLNKYTLPIVGAMVYTTRRNKKEIIYDAYIGNLFGENFEDYEYQMRNFCEDALLNEMPEEEIREKIKNGKDLIISYAKTVRAQLIPEEYDKEEAYALLKGRLDMEVRKLKSNN